MKLRLAILTLALAAAGSGETKRQIFTGEIADSSCAYNVHSLSRSHKEMLKSKEWGSSSAECTRRCVNKFGASYVLVSRGDVYRLEQQDLAEPFAGQKVKIQGTWEGPWKPIQIDAIEAAK
jgi:hypothetical protein